jgi:hypothetical protein
MDCRYRPSHSGQSAQAPTANTLSREDLGGVRRLNTF